MTKQKPIELSKFDDGEVRRHLYGNKSEKFLGFYKSYMASLKKVNQPRRRNDFSEKYFHKNDRVLLNYDQGDPLKQRNRF